MSMSTFPLNVAANYHTVPLNRNRPSRSRDTAFAANQLMPNGVAPAGSVR